MRNDLGQTTLLTALASSLALMIGVLLYSVTFAPAMLASASTGCIPPAQSWATLVSCKTATAKGVQNVQPTATPRTQEPTTTFTPVPTPQILLVRSDGVPLVCDSKASWAEKDDWYYFLDCKLVATLPPPTRIVP